MYRAPQLVSILLEADDSLDWTPDPTDPDDSTSTDTPAGYAVQWGGSMFENRKPEYLSKYPEWDGSYRTPFLHRARIFKRRSTIERNWPIDSGRDLYPVPVFQYKKVYHVGTILKKMWRIKLEDGNWLQHSDGEIAEYSDSFLANKKARAFNGKAVYFPVERA